MSAFLEIARFEVLVRFGSSGRISNAWGQTIRGGFGLILKKIACTQKQTDCRDCPLTSCCAYGFLFETPCDPSGKVMRKYTQAPHPFVFENSVRQRSGVGTGEDCCFDFLLVGKAIHYLPMVFLALQELGKQGLGKDQVPFSIQELRQYGGDTLYRADQKGNFLGKAVPEIFSLLPGKSQQGRFSLLFETPLRLQQDGQVLSDPDFFTFFSSLVRRTFLCRYFHQEADDTSLDTVFLDVASQVKVVRKDFHWMDRIRRSTRQQRDIPIGGVQGRMDCEGDVGFLMPLLRLGENLHVGKNAAFGLGKYQYLEGGNLEVS